MSYTITARLFQTNPGGGAYFQIVEQSTFGGGENHWSSLASSLVLKMVGSGTSGALRLYSEQTKEQFIIALGVHNYKRWGDIVTDLTSEATASVVNAQYYGGKRDYQREKQLPNYSVSNAKGRKVSVNYSTAEGSDLVVDIIIG